MRQPSTERLMQIWTIAFLFLLGGLALHPDLYRVRIATRQLTHTTQILHGLSTLEHTLR
jgi:hypothetical protein